MMFIYLLRKEPWNYHPFAIAPRQWKIRKVNNKYQYGTQKT